MSTEYHDLKSLRSEIHTCNGGEDCAKCESETCEYCVIVHTPEEANRLQNLYGRIVCDSCYKQGGYERHDHLLAVKDGDIDCKPMCGTCREYAHGMKEESEDLKMKEV